MIGKKCVKKRFCALDEAVSNPYIGFTSYQRFRGDPLYSDIVVRPENNGTETEAVECYPVPEEVPQRGDEQGFYPDTQVAYFRILWKEFEPRRGEYDFTLIADLLAKAKEKGQTVIFRLMPHSTRAKDDVPDWLKTLVPCPDRPDGQRVKDSPKDPAYLRYFGEAIEEIGRRFDRDPALYAVDISLTGAWGEGHKVSEYPETDLKALVDVYTRSFKNTHLIGQTAAPWLVRYADKTHPCGWRGDGVGDPKHMTVFYPKAAAEMPKDGWKTAPVSFESYWWLGEWDRKGWDLDEIVQKTLSWHVSTFNAKSLPIPPKWRDKIAFWTSKMGYHFHLSSFTYPSCLTAGRSLRFRAEIQNRGVAPIYDAVPFVVRLKGEKEYLFKTDLDPRGWLPGENRERGSFLLPMDVAAGDYDLEVSLSGGGYPVVRFETQAERDGDYYKVGKITVTKKARFKPFLGKNKGGSQSQEKEYLRSFLSDFGFEEEAGKVLCTAFDAIASDPKSIALYQKMLRRYRRDPDVRFSRLGKKADEIAARSGINPYTVYLTVLILLSQSSRTVYERRGLSEETWRRNMMDLKYTCDLCKPMKGVCGTYCFGWYGRFFSGTRVCFGKLQFELNPFGRTFDKGDLHLRADSPVIFIHIPRTGERLFPADVDAACAEASEYFKRRYGLRSVVFACHSWLIYPLNREILSEGSNLYDFISRFEIAAVEEDTEYRELWRLFDKEYDGDPDSLPRDTSLRRAYADRVKEGKPLGIGLGVWLYRE